MDVSSIDKYSIVRLMNVRNGFDLTEHHTSLSEFLHILEDLLDG